MDYELRLGSQFELSGFKQLRDDPGPDIWRDTTALFVKLRGPAPGGEVQWHYGMLNVALNHFLFKQMRSATVTTDEAARIVWALSSFGLHFFGGLQSVYFPALPKALEWIKELEAR